MKVLEDARRLLGPVEEIERRQKLIAKRLEIYAEDDSNDLGSPPELAFDPPRIHLDRKREILEGLLRRINARRPDSSRS